MEYITCAKDCVSIARAFGKDEAVVVLHLGGANRHLGGACYRPEEGKPVESILEERMREIIREAAITNNAEGVAIVICRKEGVLPTPSNIELIAKVKSTLKPVLALIDVIVLVGDRYFSFADEAETEYKEEK